MRKLVILGNGFDISHGLRTKYEDFLYNYLVKCLINSVLNRKMGINGKEYTYEHTDLLISIKYHSLEFDTRIMNLVQTEHIYEFVEKYNDFRKLMDELIKRDMINQSSYGSLLNIIYENKLIYNWVDIEIEYYDNLKKLLFDDNTKPHKELTKIGEVQKLNCELDFIKSELIKYLKSIVIDIKKQFYDDESLSFLSEFNKLFFSFPDREINNSSILFINFNYTNTLRDLYFESKDYEIINVHGHLESELDDIVFGFGNNNDTKFKDLIQMREKDICLKYNKMYHYSNTDLYSKIMSFMNGNNFDIKIIGHSCGISDSTLLSDIFEHQNLKKIEVYYHDKNNDRKKDSFQSIIKNISSHFEDIKKWRKLGVSFDVDKRIPQSPNVQFNLLNKNYVKTEFTDISDYLKSIYKYRITPKKNRVDIR